MLPAELPSRTDEELIAAARRLPEPHARRLLDELYRRHYERVRRWCLRIARDRDAAADLVQDVFLKIHAQIDTFRGECRFSTWLYVVTRRVALDRARVEARSRQRHVGMEQCPPLPARGATPEESLERRRLARELRRLVARSLDATDAQVFRLHFLEHETLPRITGSLRLTNTSGAKRHIVRSQRRLRRELASGSWPELTQYSNRAHSACG